MTHILVADDDQDLRENLEEILKDEGFSVCLAKDGQEAMSCLGSSSFDLVLLDFVMPVMGGMEVLTQIKRLHPKTKVIMMTAFSTVDSAVEAMRQGADDYITKPFKINDLLVAVRRCLEEARFSGCDKLLDMDDVFKCLANATRRQILMLLKEYGRLRFMDITRNLKIDDHTKVNFHLKILKEAQLLAQDNQKNYFLSEKGEKIIVCMSSVSSV